MIRLDVQLYCELCREFEPDVTRPETLTTSDGIYQTDTIISCRYAKRCENIKRYLARTNKNEERG